MSREMKDHMSKIYQGYIQKALKSAAYHENLAFLYAHPDAAKYDELVTHLRSYYWELWSVWDYIIQAVNERTLKLSKQNVRNDFIQKLKSGAPGYSHIADLERVYRSERLVRINELRNYSHKWRLDPNLVEIDTDDKVSVIAFDPKGGVGTFTGQINIDRNDLWYMADVVKSFSASGIL